MPRARARVMKDEPKVQIPDAEFQIPGVEQRIIPQTTAARF